MVCYVYMTIVVNKSPYYMNIVFIVDIVQSTGNTLVEVQHLDLSSLDLVRKFANNIINREPRLDVLVNNAGAGGIDNKVTADNLQLGMQVNHFGPFLLTCLLVGKT